MNFNDYYYALKRKLMGKGHIVVGVVLVTLFSYIGICLLPQKNLEQTKKEYFKSNNNSIVKKEINKRITQAIENSDEIENKLANKNNLSTENNETVIENTLNLTQTNESNTSEQIKKDKETNNSLPKETNITSNTPVKVEQSNSKKEENKEEKQEETLKSEDNLINENQEKKVQNIMNNIGVLIQNIPTGTTMYEINDIEEDDTLDNNTLEDEKLYEIIDIETEEDTKDSISEETNKTTDNTTNKTTNKTTKTTTKKVKNGWYKEGKYTYYYKNGKKLKDTYINYIYVDSKGRKQDKMGSFTATLYGARAWANQTLNIRSKANSSSSIIGTVPTGGKVTILSGESTTYYLKVKYGSKTGYVYAGYLMINLPDVMPDLYYNITNSSGSIYKSAGYSIPGITGKNLYGFKKQQNNKIDKKTYYAPLLYPVAKQLQKAYNKAKKEGYSFKIYDTYRPRDITLTISSKLGSLYNSNSKVRKAINYDKNGAYWGQGWFLAQTVSNHNRGIALDMTLTNSKGKEYTMQSKMHTLDTTSLVKYNNKNANKLRNIMTNAGFETLSSEWWHFEEVSYKSSPYNSFRIK